MDTITPREIKERLLSGEKLNIIDVREDEEIAEGMIPGARHIRLGDLPMRMSEIEQTGEIIMVCRSGRRSERACEYLEHMGFSGLKNMVGGMLKWHELE